MKEFGNGATFLIAEGFEFQTDKENYMTWEQIAEFVRLAFKLLTTHGTTWPLRRQIIKSNFTAILNLRTCSRLGGRRFKAGYRFMKVAMYRERWDD